MKYIFTICWCNILITAQGKVEITLETVIEGVLLRIVIHSLECKLFIILEMKCFAKTFLCPQHPPLTYLITKCRVGVMLPCQSFTCKLNMQFTCDNENLPRNRNEEGEKEEGPHYTFASSSLSGFGSSTTLLRLVKAKWISLVFLFL